jgi:hypothetical protein
MLHLRRVNGAGIESGQPVVRRIKSRCRWDRLLVVVDQKLRPSSRRVLGVVVDQLCGGACCCKVKATAQQKGEKRMVALVYKGSEIGKRGLVWRVKGLSPGWKARGNRVFQSLSAFS